MRRRGPPDPRITAGACVAWLVIVACVTSIVARARWRALWPRFDSDGWWAIVGALVAAGLVAVLRRPDRLRVARFGTKPLVESGNRHLEAFAVYLGCAVLVTLVARRRWPDERWLGHVAWYGAPVAALLWLRLRGLSWRDVRRQLGLHRGRGVLREVACGVVGYVAIQSCVSLYRWATDTVFDASSLDWSPMPALAILAGGLLWAPLVEETLFRGALYRGLRRFAGWRTAALVSAIIFAVGHRYPGYWLGHVVSGFGFAMLREWRGSLIAAMTAHFLMNAVPSYELISRLVERAWN